MAADCVFVIRDECADDEAAITAVQLQAFANSPVSQQTEHLIVVRLRAAGALGLSLVAAQGTEALGHVAFSPVTINGRAGRWSGLGPIAVQPAHQRSGIGSALVRSGLRRLRERGGEGCVLLGDPAYCARFGFAAYPGLQLPGVPPDHFMALAFDGPVPQGVVAYHEAFASTA